MFNERTEKTILHKGYRLLAIDGSVLPISNAIKDNRTTLYTVNNSDKAFSAYHLNTSNDLLEGTYDDIILQRNAVMNEDDAFNEIGIDIMGLEPFSLQTEATNPSILLYM